MNDIEIMKALFKAFSGGETICVELKDGSTQPGTISSFDGEKIMIAGQEIALAEIAGIGAPESMPVNVDGDDSERAHFSSDGISSLKLSRIGINYYSDTSEVEEEGILFDICEDRIVLITDTEKKVIFLKDITEVTQIHDDVILGYESTSDEYKVTAFEQAVIAGEKSAVDGYLTGEDVLCAAGYSEKEADRILSVSRNPVPWNDDDKNRTYNQARRVYTYVGNRGRIAEKLFIQSISESTLPFKLRIKAVSALLDILGGGSTLELSSFVKDNIDVITGNTSLRLKAASLLIKGRDYITARSLVDESRADIDFSETLFALSFYEQNEGFDPSELKGVNAFDESVGFKEITNLLRLPDKNACIQLLTAYEKTGRVESFFALLDLFMPYARTEGRIVSLVGECLKKTGPSEYLEKYLVEFPLLWFNKTLSDMYAASHIVSRTDNKKTMRLLNQCKRSSLYGAPNPFEDAVIKGNFQLCDVLRSNDGIMSSLGYSNDEINTIRSVESDYFKYGTKPVIEKLLFLEGNKNYIPESTTAIDFLRAPESVSRALFPLLINEGFGDIVYELFNYTPYHRQKLSELKPFYLKALLLLNEKEEYWDEVKNDWMTLDLDDQMLLAAREIAASKGDQASSDAITAFINKPDFNELENVLISGEVSRLRSLSVDADTLISQDYSTDEIKQIQSSTRSKIDFISKDSLSIANRIYAFQKNKNRTAELFYKMALKEDPQSAALGLLSIYSEEGRYKELCDCFETYLKGAVSSLTISNIDSYLMALYYTGQFGNMKEYWISESRRSTIDSLYVLKAFLEVSSSDDDIKLLLNSPLVVTKDNSAVALDCALKLCGRTISDTTANAIIRLYNQLFCFVDADTILQLCQNITHVVADYCVRPNGSGILAIFEDNNSQLLYEWCDLLFARVTEGDTQLTILRNIAAVYGTADAVKGLLKDKLINLSKDGTMLPAELEVYLYPQFSDDSEKIVWLDSFLGETADIEEFSFNLFVKYTKELNDINRLYSLLVKLEEQDIEFKDAYRAAVIDTLSVCVKEQYERSKVEELLNCLRHNHGKIIANTEDLTTLYQAYVYVGNDNYAFLTKIAISSGAGGLDFAEDDDRIEACSFTSVVTNTLAGDEVHEIDSLSAVFGKYIRTTEQDALCLSELRDYYNTPEKWSEDSVEALMKYLIKDVSIQLYWNLAAIYFESAEEVIKANVQYHIALIEKANLKPVYAVYAKQGLREQSISILKRNFENTDPNSFESDKEAVLLLISKRPEWVQSHETALDLLAAARANSALRNDPVIWNDVLDILMRVSFSGGAEKEFYEITSLTPLSNTVSIIRRFVCRLILEKPEENALINEALNSMRSFPDHPLCKMVSDLMDTSDTADLSAVKKEQLKIAGTINADSVDEMELYGYYVNSVAAGNGNLALKALMELKRYIPELQVYEDVEKYETLSGSVEDQDVLKIYTDEFTALRKMTIPERIQKTITNMLAGEVYLKAKGFEIESALDYGKSVLARRVAERVQQRRELISSLDNVFDREKYPGLVEVFLKCCFLRKWDEFMSYSLEDKYINDIIRNDDAVKTLLFKKSYEVLKGAVISILNADRGNSEIIDRTDAMIVTTGGINRSKNYLRRIQNMSDEERDILRNVFGLRIESKTLRESGIIGTAILKIPGNEKVAYLIGMLETRSLVEIFNHPNCLNALLEMPDEDATAISGIYTTFFFKNINNVFKQYLNKQIESNGIGSLKENPFDIAVDICKYSRERYQRALDRYNSKDESLPKMALKNLTKSYTAARLEYLYEAVISDSYKDIDLINPIEMDYLSAIIWLFNKKTTAEIKDYLWHLEEENIYASLSVILALLEQYPLAYNAAERENTLSWQEAALHVLYRLITFGTTRPDDKPLRDLIYTRIPYQNGYFIGKFYPVAADQNPIYVDKMCALKDLFIEFLAYAEFRGADISWVSFDNERFETTLEKYKEKSYAEKPEDITVIANKEASPVNGLYEVISQDVLYQRLSSTMEIDASEYSGSGTPQIRECISGLRYLLDYRQGSTDKKDILTARDLIRWLYLLYMNDEGYSREYLNRLLELISAEDRVSYAQWNAIISYLSQYFDSIGSLPQLARVIENDISNLQNISLITGSARIKRMRDTDKQSWENIIGVLVAVAGIDFTRTQESEQIARLSACRSKLIFNAENIQSSIFSNINDKLLRLIGEQITVLRNAPELLVTVLGENSEGVQEIVWETGNNSGTLYAVVSNMGGADCQRVSLKSSFNLMKERKYTIERVYSGERIPFKVSFSSEDLFDNKLTWDLEVSYYDSDRDQMASVTHESKVVVSYGDEVLTLGNISTGNPARGKNFVGRSRELAILRNHYSDIDQLPSMLIRGLKRSGKSSILIRFTEEMRKKNTFLVASVDGQSIGSELKTAFIDKVLDSIRISYRSLNEFEAVFNEHYDGFKSAWEERLNSSDWIGQLDGFYYELSQLFGKKILIVIDEMESIFYNHRFESVQQEESLYAALRSLIQRPDNYVSFIFCGSDALLTSCLEQRRESQMFQTLQYLEVGHMNIGDIREIYRKQSEKYDIDFTPDAVDTIWQFTHGLVWYAKLLGYLVINNIMSHDLTIRKEVNRSDIMTAIQMLINGEIGTDKYDLVDASLNTPRTAIVHAMASIMPDYNKMVSVNEVVIALEALRKEGYINPRNGEPIPVMDEATVKGHLDFLEKMQFVDANAARTKYLFTAELYRLFFRKDKKLHMFEERSEKRQ